jgi:hypothetical protein
MADQDDLARARRQLLNRTRPVNPSGEPSV